MTSILGDIRHVDFGGPYDLVMILYGEFNVFSPAEALTILNKVWASLSPQGQENAWPVSRPGRYKCA